MKKNYGSVLLRNLTGLGLVVTIFVSSSMVALAAPGNALSGEIIVSGQKVDGVAPSVSLNGENVMTGRTFFTSAVIATSAANSAIINLGKLGRVSLSPNSNLSISLSENGISGDLTSGQIQVFNSEGVAVNIRTPDNRITNEASLAGDVKVDLTSGTTVASYEAGQAFLENGEPATPAAWSKRKKGWVAFGVVAGIVAVIAIAYYATRDETIVSPRR